MAGHGGHEALPLWPVGIVAFGTRNPDGRPILAYASMITLPVPAAFMIFQRWFIRSVMASRGKG